MATVAQQHGGLFGIIEKRGFHPVYNVPSPPFFFLTL